MSDMELAEVEGEKLYNPKDVVWVKLSGMWWPAEVQDQDTLDPEVTEGLKKPLLCVVQFLLESSYLHIKSLEQIYHYNCKKKIEFLKLGFKKYTKNKNEKNVSIWPDVIQEAERRTGGNPDIINDPEILPVVEKPEAVGTRVSFSKKRASLPTAAKRGQAFRHSLPSDHSSGAKMNDSRPSNRTKVIGSNGRGTQHLCVTFIQRMTPVDDTPKPLVVDYDCYRCSFKTQNLDRYVFHYKMSHMLYGGRSVLPTHVSQPGPSRLPKPKKERKRKEEIQSPVMKKRKKKSVVKFQETPALSKKEEEPPSALEVSQECEQILKDWDDEDDDVQDGERPSPLEDMAVDENSTSQAGGEESTARIDDVNPPDLKEISSKESKALPPPPKAASCFDFDDEEPAIPEVQNLKFGQKLPRVISPEKSKPSVTDILTDGKELESFLNEVSVPQLPSVPTIKHAGPSLREYKGTSKKSTSPSKKNDTKSETNEEGNGDQEKPEDKEVKSNEDHFLALGPLQCVQTNVFGLTEVAEDGSALKNLKTHMSDETSKPIESVFQDQPDKEHDMVGSGASDQSKMSKPLAESVQIGEPEDSSTPKNKNLISEWDKQSLIDTLTYSPSSVDTDLPVEANKKGKRKNKKPPTLGESNKPMFDNVDHTPAPVGASTPCTNKSDIKRSKNASSRSESSKTTNTTSTPVGRPESSRSSRRRDSLNNQSKSSSGDVVSSQSSDKNASLPKNSRLKRNSKGTKSSKSSESSDLKGRNSRSPTPKKKKISGSFKNLKTDDLSDQFEPPLKDSTASDALCTPIDSNIDVTLNKEETSSSRRQNSSDEKNESITDALLRECSLGNSEIDDRDSSRFGFKLEDNRDDGKSWSSNLDGTQDSIKFSKAKTNTASSFERHSGTKRSSTSVEDLPTVENESENSTIPLKKKEFLEVSKLMPLKSNEKGSFSKSHEKESLVSVNDTKGAKKDESNNKESRHKRRSASIVKDCEGVKNTEERTSKTLDKPDHQDSKLEDSRKGVEKESCEKLDRKSTHRSETRRSTKDSTSSSKTESSRSRRSSQPDRRRVESPEYSSKSEPTKSSEEQKKSSTSIDDKSRSKSRSSGSRETRSSSDAKRLSRESSPRKSVSSGQSITKQSPKHEKGSSELAKSSSSKESLQNEEKTKPKEDSRSSRRKHSSKASSNEVDTSDNEKSKNQSEVTPSSNDDAHRAQEDSRSSRRKNSSKTSSSAVDTSDNGESKNQSEVTPRSNDDEPHRAQEDSRSSRRKNSSKASSSAVDTSDNGESKNQSEVTPRTNDDEPHRAQEDSRSSRRKNSSKASSSAVDTSDNGESKNQSEVTPSSNDDAPHRAQEDSRSLRRKHSSKTSSSAVDTSDNGESKNQSEVTPSSNDDAPHRAQEDSRSSRRKHSSKASSSAVDTSGIGESKNQSEVTLRSNDDEPHCAQEDSRSSRRKHSSKTSSSAVDTSEYGELKNQSEVTPSSNDDAPNRAQEDSRSLRRKHSSKTSSSAVDTSDNGESKNQSEVTPSSNDDAPHRAQEDSRSSRRKHSSKASSSAVDTSGIGESKNQSEVTPSSNDDAPHRAQEDSRSSRRKHSSKASSSAVDTSGIGESKNQSEVTPSSNDDAPHCAQEDSRSSRRKHSSKASSNAVDTSDNGESKNQSDVAPSSNDDAPHRAQEDSRSSRRKHSSKASSSAVDTSGIGESKNQSEVTPSSNDDAPHRAQEDSRSLRRKHSSKASSNAVDTYEYGESKNQSEVTPSSNDDAPHRAQEDPRSSRRKHLSKASSSAVDTSGIGESKNQSEVTPSSNDDAPHRAQEDSRSSRRKLSSKSSSNAVDTSGNGESKNQSEVSPKPNDDASHRARSKHLSRTQSQPVALDSIQAPSTFEAEQEDILDSSSHVDGLVKVRSRRENKDRTEAPSANDVISSTKDEMKVSDDAECKIRQSSRLQESREIAAKSSSAEENVSVDRHNKKRQSSRLLVRKEAVGDSEQLGSGSPEAAADVLLPRKKRQSSRLLSSKEAVSESGSSAAKKSPESKETIEELSSSITSFTDGGDSRISAVEEGRHDEEMVLIKETREECASDVDGHKVDDLVAGSSKSADFTQVGEKRQSIMESKEAGDVTSEPSDEKGRESTNADLPDPFSTICAQKLVKIEEQSPITPDVNLTPTKTHIQLTKTSPAIHSSLEDFNGESPAVDNKSFGSKFSSVSSTPASLKSSPSKTNSSHNNFNSPFSSELTTPLNENEPVLQEICCSSAERNVPIKDECDGDSLTDDPHKKLGSPIQVVDDVKRPIEGLGEPTKPENSDGSPSKKLKALTRDSSINDQLNNFSLEISTSSTAEAALAATHEGYKGGEESTTKPTKQGIENNLLCNSVEDLENRESNDVESTKLSIVEGAHSLCSEVKFNEVVEGKSSACEDLSGESSLEAQMDPSNKEDPHSAEVLQQVSANESPVDVSSNEQEQHVDIPMPSCGDIGDDLVTPVKTSDEVPSSERSIDISANPSQITEDLKQFMEKEDLAELKYKTLSNDKFFSAEAAESDNVVETNTLQQDSRIESSQEIEAVVVMEQQEKKFEEGNANDEMLQANNLPQLDSQIHVASSEVVLPVKSDEAEQVKACVKEPLSTPLSVPTINLVPDTEVNNQDSVGDASTQVQSPSKLHLATSEPSSIEAKSSDAVGKETLDVPTSPFIAARASRWDNPFPAKSSAKCRPLTPIQFKISPVKTSLSPTNKVRVEIKSGLGRSCFKSQGPGVKATKPVQEDVIEPQAAHQSREHNEQLMDEGAVKADNDLDELSALQAEIASYSIIQDQYKTDAETLDSKCSETESTKQSKAVEDCGEFQSSVDTNNEKTENSLSFDIPLDSIPLPACDKTELSKIPVPTPKVPGLREAALLASLLKDNDENCSIEQVSGADSPSKQISSSDSIQSPAMPTFVKQSDSPSETKSILLSPTITSLADAPVVISNIPLPSEPPPSQIDCFGSSCEKLPPIVIPVEPPKVANQVSSKESETPTSSVQVLEVERSQPQSGLVIDQSKLLDLNDIPFVFEEDLIEEGLMPSESSSSNITQNLENSSEVKPCIDEEETFAIEDLVEEVVEHEPATDSSLSGNAVNNLNVQETAEYKVYEARRVRQYIIEVSDESDPNFEYNNSLPVAPVGKTAVAKVEARDDQTAVPLKVVKTVPIQPKKVTAEAKYVSVGSVGKAIGSVVKTGMSVSGIKYQSVKTGKSVNLGDKEVQKGQSGVVQEIPRSKEPLKLHMIKDASGSTKFRVTPIVTSIGKVGGKLLLSQPLKTTSSVGVASNTFVSRSPSIIKINKTPLSASKVMAARGTSPVVLKGKPGRGHLVTRATIPVQRPTKTKIITDKKQISVDSSGLTNNNNANESTSSPVIISSGNPFVIGTPSSSQQTKIVGYVVNKPEPKKAGKDLLEQALTGLDVQDEPPMPTATVVYGVLSNPLQQQRPIMSTAVQPSQVIISHNQLLSFQDDSSTVTPTNNR